MIVAKDITSWLILLHETNVGNWQFGINITALEE